MSRRHNQVPVRTEGSGTQYDGRVWYELISSLRTVNGVAVEDIGTPLDKSHLKQGDRVTLDFDGKIFSGVIDFECTSTSPSHSPPSESPQRKLEHHESPSKTSGVVSEKTEAGVAPLEEDPLVASRKRKGPAAETKKPKRRVVEKTAGTYCIEPTPPLPLWLCTENCSPTLFPFAFLLTFSVAPVYIPYNGSV